MVRGIEQIRLVGCEEQYWEFVRCLRNDHRVQEGFVEHTYITQEQQKAYMEQHSQHYRVALIGDEPVGYVGVLEDDIRICSHPDFQGRGVGTFMLRSIQQEYPTAYGKVKINNDASRRLFKKSGFVESFIIFTRVDG